MNSYNLGNLTNEFPIYSLDNIVNIRRPSIEVHIKNINNHVVYILNETDKCLSIKSELNTFKILDLVIRAKSVLGMGKIDVSKHLKISRQTLERHILGRTIDAKIIPKYEFLNDIINTLESQFGTKISDYSGNIIVDGTTFREYFKSGATDLIDKAKKLLAKTENASVAPYQTPNRNRTIGVGKQG
ncbi:hypothetical protein [Colwellia sp. TT2012]|uniref:hypothetical protein n=1 Tax=Colwellia sp. TT2012 TaxID=1720342 RepID=UPI00070E9216|nr:hypothetical protein [Colwellia sp. TT2012]